MDVPLLGDIKFQYEGVIVLALSDAYAERYSGQTLDVNAAGDFLLR